jgi:hypothetical protein
VGDGRALAAAAALLLAAGCSPPAQRAPAAPVAFGADRRWDDGRAEFSTYRGWTPRYGQARPTTAHLIVVKEDQVRATLVKSDSGPVAGRTREVLKLNVIADFPTGTYDYHQMASVFFDRATLEVLKESMSHTEGCGITTVRIAPRDGRWMHEAHSYWDGEADRVVPLAWPSGERPHLFWDALPVSLRAWADERTPREWKVWLLPSQLSSRSPIENTRPMDAVIRRMAGAGADLAAGHVETVEFEIASRPGPHDRPVRDVFTFDARPPHVLLRLATNVPAGRTLELVKTQRLDYWNHTAPGDEKLVE